MSVPIDLVDEFVICKLLNHNWSAYEHLLTCGYLSAPVVMESKIQSFSIKVLHLELQGCVQLTFSLHLPIVLSHLEALRLSSTPCVTKRSEIGGFCMTARQLGAHSQSCCVRLTSLLQSNMIKQPNYLRKLWLLEIVVRCSLNVATVLRQYAAPNHLNVTIS